ncbi:MAG: HNH endonuclease [bacterium]|nr:HNH endonuclease [bacterium]MDE0352952.1 HNH endonuclease [bacterium]
MYEAPTFHDADSILVAENNLKDTQREIDRLRGRQLAWLKMVMRHRGIVRDGYRSLIDWTASRLDIPHTVARDLAYLARRLDDDTIDLIGRGHLPFDRTVSQQRLLQAGATPADVAASEDLDLAGVTKLATRFRKLSRGDERSAFERQYVNLRVSDDGAVWHLSGRLTATDGQLVRQALDRRADQIPPLTPEFDPELSPAQRQAIGLATMAQDDLDQNLTPGDPAGREPVIMLIKDETLANRSDDTQGVELFNGPRVGRLAVETAECEGRTEEVTIQDSQVVEIGPTRRHIPKRLRRAVLARDRRCVIDSCQSSYRLQTHHVIPKRDGGPDTADNLTTLCWYHHHIAVHRKGHRIDPHTPPHRRRLLPPRTWAHYRHPTNLEYLSPHEQQQRAYQSFLDKYHPQQPHPGG